MVYKYHQRSCCETDLIIDGAKEKVVAGRSIDDEELHFLQLLYPNLLGPRFLERLRAQLVHLRFKTYTIMSGGANRSSARPQGKVSEKTRRNRNKLRKVVFPKGRKNRL